MKRLQRALISVSDKSGVLELAQRLTASGVELLSTGGTAKALRSAGLRVTEVAEYTGFPEIMDGRVKTLHPRIHAGLLARPGTDDKVLAEHDIQPIGLLVVNLYPFVQTIAREDCTRELAVENIDIGGPAMLRAAAKNHAGMAVLVNPEDYAQAIAQIEATGSVDEPTRRALACKAFAHTAQYDQAITEYLSAQETGHTQTAFPASLSLQLARHSELRYGENPHQQAAFYTRTDARSGSGEASVANAIQLQGKALSFNNLGDADAALECVKSFAAPACVIVKHANPCGVATDANITDAYERAYLGDPKSAFGGIIALNRPLDATLAQRILERQFVEVIMAPQVQVEAREVLAGKPNVRVLQTGTWDHTKREPALEYRSVRGGVLVQDTDTRMFTADEFKCVTKRRPDAQELKDLLFAWQVVKYVKSNAIVYARDGMSIGIGAGQMSRVYSARIAVIKAEEEGLSVQGAAMASDAFFPFRDTIDDAAANGIRAIVHPGGSIRDEQVIEAANEHGIAMVHTGVRHFRH